MDEAKNLRAEHPPIEHDAMEDLNRSELGPTVDDMTPVVTDDEARLLEDRTRALDHEPPEAADLTGQVNDWSKRVLILLGTMTVGFGGGVGASLLVIYGVIDLNTGWVRALLDLIAGK